MKRLIVLAGLVFLFGGPTSAQILNALKKTATDIGRDLNTKENRDKALSIAQNNLAKARASFDSTDFDYAILISDNSGFIDIKEKGERLVKAGSAASNLLNFMNDKEANPSEQARTQLEMGEVWYGSRNFKLAESSFTEAKKLYDRTV
jgi:hypothetical protein